MPEVSIVQAAPCLPGFEAKEQHHDADTLTIAIDRAFSRRDNPESELESLTPLSVKVLSTF
jgi:hypothetical protein